MVDKAEETMTYYVWLLLQNFDFLLKPNLAMFSSCIPPVLSRQKKL